jgi:glycosyltransferase involved in cell wall biosynthesis
MNILINALSVTNPSGRHVLLGHLSQFSKATRYVHQYFVLYHAANRNICEDLGENVHWVECPGYTRHWAARSAWERTKLNAVISKQAIDTFFTPTGTVVAGLKVPQISFAQNPWCLVPGIPRKPMESLKAMLQRRAYRQAMRQASMMIFNSEYMRQAYRANAGFNEKTSEIIYQGINEETFQAAESMKSAVQRKPFQVLSVSLMAPHKVVETQVRAIKMLSLTYGLEAHLVLVGGWPNLDYHQKVRGLVAELKLENQVEFRGHIPQEDLHRSYAESKVYCLMSRCESFGIPALEAQAFGTPIIGSNQTAMPEICGEGGLYLRPTDVEGVAHHLHQLLTNQELWEKYSWAAVRNASRYHWETCSRRFVDVFEKVQPIRKVKM